MSRLLFAAAVLLAGCASGSTVSREYEWIQQANGLAMRAPIKYRVRWSWTKDTLNWSMNVTDADGRQQITTEKHYSFMSPITAEDCTYWDDDNWSCTLTGAKREVLTSQTMKEGQLTWFYWTEKRIMTKRYRLWNKALPF